MDSALYIRQAVEQKLSSMIFLVKRNERYMEETRESLLVVPKRHFAKNSRKDEDTKFLPVVSKKEYAAMRKLYNEKLIQTLEVYVGKVKEKADINPLKIQNLNALLDRTVIDLEEEYGFYRDLVNLIKAASSQEQGDTVSIQYQNTMKQLNVNRSEIVDDLNQLKKRMKAM